MQMANTTPPKSQEAGPRKKALLIFAIVMVVLAGYGFSVRFFEFLHTLQAGDSGNFIIVPLLSYLAVAAGFLCLFGWATFYGMFRDVERPKYTMLENEEKLDRGDKATL